MKLTLILLLCIALSLPARSAFAESEEKRWEAGFGRAEIALEEKEIPDQYVAGYRNDHPATAVLDPQCVKALYLSDGTENVLLLSVDCVALGSGECARIRKLVNAAVPGCGSIHVISTHDHAGSDTLGLWGPVGLDGKNASFMYSLREAAVRAAEQAYAARTKGTLSFGSITTDDIQEDTRAPIVYDPNLYCFRFVPDDASVRTIRVLNYASHAESLDGDNTLLSADFPAYVAKELDEIEHCDVIWFPGAIGGLIRTRFLISDRVENCCYTARRIAEYALAIENWRELQPSLTQASQPFSAKCENPLFLAMQATGVLEEDARPDSITSTSVHTALHYLSIGGVPVLLVPGEIFPELVYGDSTRFKPAFPEKTLPPLTDIFGSELLVFGLTDDEIGYIVSPDNFVLNEKAPYLERQKDKYGEDHYEETNSLGPDTAKALYDAALLLYEQIRK